MQLTLGEVIATLNSYSRDTSVKNGWSCCSAYSYRGDYSHLAFDLTGETTVGEMLDEAMSACGRTYEGWKGGDYEMDEDTPCHITGRDCSGDELSAFYLKAMINESDDWI